MDCSAVTARRSLYDLFRTIEDSDLAGERVQVVDGPHLKVLQRDVVAWGHLVAVVHCSSSASNCTGKKRGLTSSVGIREVPCTAPHVLCSRFSGERKPLSTRGVERIADKSYRKKKENHVTHFSVERAEHVRCYLPSPRRWPPSSRFLQGARPSVRSVRFAPRRRVCGRSRWQGKRPSPGVTVVRTGALVYGYNCK